MKEENNNQQNFSPENNSKQIIYMVPSESYNDEIDLFRLLIPPIKYKVQIILIFTLGILISGGVIWYNSSFGLDSIIKEQIINAQTAQKQIEIDLKYAEENLFTVLDNIPDKGTVYKIKGADIQFIDKEDPEKVQVFHLDSYRDTSNRLDEELDKGTTDNKPSQTPQYPLESKSFKTVLLIQKISIIQIKERLVESYQNIIHLENDISDLEFQIRLEELQLYILTQKKQDLISESLLTDTSNIDQLITTHRSNLRSKSQKLSYRQTEKSNLQNQIDELHETLADNVQFESDQNKIPLEIWNNIRSQSDNVERERQITIKNSAKKINHIVADRQMYKIVQYIFENKLRVPLNAFEWPAFEYLSTPEKKEKINFSISKLPILRSLIIGTVITILLALMSVYIRTFWGQAKENRELRQKIQSLTDAAGYWKL